MERIGGTIQVQIDGQVHRAKGAWTYNLGKPKREVVVGADAVHGYKETPAIPFVEGEITDRGDMDLAAVSSSRNVTVTLSLANGKVILLRDAVAAGDWVGNTDEGNISARFEGSGAEEVPA